MATELRFCSGLADEQVALLFPLFLRLRQQAGIDDLQAIVFREIENEVIGERLDLAQLLVDNDRLHAAEHGRTDIGRILQMRMRSTASFRAEARHYAAQALCPVAGTKRPAIAGNALYEKLARDRFLFLHRIGHLCGFSIKRLLSAPIMRDADNKNGNCQSSLWRAQLSKFLHIISYRRHAAKQHLTI
jgi:hypothetical protein